MKRRALWLICAALAARPLIASAAVPFTAGNIVVSRAGDGVTVMSGGQAAAAFLDEYTPTGTLVQSVPMPTSVSGNQRRLTLTWDNMNEGFVTRSVDGRYLLLTGYDAAVSTNSVNATANTANGGIVDRVVSRIDQWGTVDTSTALSVNSPGGDSSFSGNSIRSAASVDGTTFYATGATSNGNTGVRYISSLGANSSLRLGQSQAVNSRVVNIFPDVRTTGNTGGLQMYDSRGSGSNAFNYIGTGLPTNGNSSANNPVVVFNAASATSVYDFVIMDLDPNVAGHDTAYLTNDDASNLSPGLQKWALVGGVWTYQYNLADGLSNKAIRGLTSTLDGAGNVVLYATLGNGTQLVGVTDLGTNSVFTTIATATSGTFFHGVELTPVPEPTALALLSLGGLVLVRRRRVV